LDTRSPPNGAFTVRFPLPPPLRSSSAGLTRAVVAIWLTISKLGSVIAGAIELALNVDGAEKGSITPSTYLILLGIQCFGLPLAFLISPPDRLIRSDGSRPSVHTAAALRSWESELHELGSLLRRKEILLLLPVFISSQWGQTYNGNFLAAYFTVRARALLAFVAAVLAMMMNLSTGWILDLSGYRRSLKARYSWLLIACLFTVMWALSLSTQSRFASGPVDLDWSSPGFGHGAASYLFFRFRIPPLAPW